MLNSNKRSIELNTKTAEGKEVMEKLIREADILVENFHLGAIDHMGFTGSIFKKSIHVWFLVRSKGLMSVRLMWM